MSLSFNDCILLRDICVKLNDLKYEPSSITEKIHAFSSDYCYEDYSYFSISLNRSYGYTSVYLNLNNSDIIRCDDNQNEFSRIRNTTKKKIIISNNRDHNLYKIDALSGDYGDFYVIPSLPGDEDEFDSIRFQNSLIIDEEFHLNAITVASFILTIGLEESNMVDLHLTPLCDSGRLLFIHTHIDEMCDEIREQLQD